MTNELRDKFSPDALKVSGKMTAILECLLGGDGWVDPSIAEMCITSDGGVLGRRKGDCGYNDFIGGVDDLRQNLAGVVGVWELTREELLAFADTVTARLSHEGGGHHLLAAHELLGVERVVFEVI